MPLLLDRTDDEYPITMEKMLRRLSSLGISAERKSIRKADYAFFRRRGFAVACVQTDNGFEFTNRFSHTTRELVTLFERTAAELGSGTG